jgi:hypothetical protein
MTKLTVKFGLATVAHNAIIAIVKKVYTATSIILEEIPTGKG